MTTLYIVNIVINGGINVKKLLFVMKLHKIAGHNCQDNILKAGKYFKPKLY